jgi:hypothetical protein
MAQHYQPVQQLQAGGGAEADVRAPDNKLLDRMVRNSRMHGVLLLSCSAHAESLARESCVLLWRWGLFQQGSWQQQGTGSRTIPTAEYDTVEEALTCQYRSWSVLLYFISLVQQSSCEYTHLARISAMIWEMCKKITDKITTRITADCLRIGFGSPLRIASSPPYATWG